VTSYRDDGFTVLPGIVPQARLDDLRAALIAVARKYEPGFPDWDAPGLHDAVAAFRDRDPVAFGTFYDTLQTSVSLQAIFSLPSVVQAAAATLRDAPMGLTSTGLMLRMDVPRDPRNALTWHQDSAHYPQNGSGENGIVALVPLAPVGPENGMIVVLPGSHREGGVGHGDPRVSGGGGSLQLDIPQAVIERYPQATLEADAGDLILCHMDLIHRSGTNRSAKVRFTAGARFHRALADDFLPGRLAYVPSGA
jgi:hypothetical protein